MTAAQAQQIQKLEPPEPVQMPEAKQAPAPVKTEDSIAMAPDLTEEQEQKLHAEATEYVDKLTKLNPNSPEFQQEMDAISNIGQSAFTATSNITGRFTDRTVASQLKEGGPQASVSQSLLDLRNKTSELDPDETTGILAHLPFVNTMKSYARKYQSAQVQIDKIMENLDKGADGLLQDNAALKASKVELWNQLGVLKRAFELLSSLKTATQERIETETDPQLKNKLQNDTLFKINKRIQDVQTQAAVTIQGYLMFGVIADNNDQLIDGIKQAKTTTQAALNIAVSTAIALANQKQVIEVRDAVTKTTNDLIQKNAKMFQQNALDVQRQAVESAVSPETIRQCNNAIIATLDGIDKFRSSANQVFDKNIELLTEQMGKMQPYADRLHDGNADENQEATASDSLSIDV